MIILKNTGAISTASVLPYTSSTVLELKGAQREHISAKWIKELLARGRLLGE